MPGTYRTDASALKPWSWRSCIWIYYLLVGDWSLHVNTTDSMYWNLHAIRCFCRTLKWWGFRVYSWCISYNLWSQFFFFFFGGWWGILAISAISLGIYTHTYRHTHTFDLGIIFTYFYSWLFFTEVQLIYNVVLIIAIQ